MIDYFSVYQKLLDNLKQKGCQDVFLVKKAFDVALKLHSGQFRKSGEPYIEHPVCVAKILEEMNFDADVICAGLLHDTIEDCSYTREQIASDFNINIAEIVECVSAINKNSYKIDSNNLFEDSNFEKFSMEEQTYKKLYNMGKKNRLAFYIKFADRLHNLTTIDCFPYFKQVEKVRETEKWILPIIKIMGSNTFYDKISSECFKIINKHKLGEYLLHFNHYHQLNKNIYEDIRFSIENCTEEYLKKQPVKYEIANCIIERQTEEKVYELIRKNVGINSPNLVKQSHFNKVPCNNIFLIIKNNIPIHICQSICYDLITDYLKEQLQMINFITDEKNSRYFYTLKDTKRNKYNFCVMSQKDYAIYCNGTSDGFELDEIGEESEIITNYIYVKTRSNEIMTMPENCTVLDFAYKIHKEIGFSCEYAIINDAPTRYPLFTKLRNGDKINLICAKNEDGSLKNICKLRHLAYVKTEYAQKILIKYFEKITNK